MRAVAILTLVETLKLRELGSCLHHMSNERTAGRTLLFALQNETQDKVTSTEAGDLQGFAGPDVERVGERSGEAKAALLRSGTLEAHAVQLRIQREMSGEQRILLAFEMSKGTGPGGYPSDHPEWRRRKSRANSSDSHSFPSHYRLGLKSDTRTLNR
jgi:hypothetical protein